MEVTCKKCDRLLNITRDWDNNTIHIECPIHKLDWKTPKEKKDKRGRYSGFSKSNFHHNEY